MSNNTPYMKVNDSDKQRPSDGKILPDMHGHTSGEEGGCGEKAKQHKFKIIGVVVVLLIGVILLVTLTGSSGDNPNPPGPTPPGPTPPAPIPANSGFNPYYLDENSTISAQKNKVSGTLFFNQTVIDNGPKMTFGENGTTGVNLTLTPNEIPRGVNSNLTT